MACIKGERVFSCIFLYQKAEQVSACACPHQELDIYLHSPLCRACICAFALCMYLCVLINLYRNLSMRLHVLAGMETRARKPERANACVGSYQELSVYLMHFTHPRAYHATASICRECISYVAMHQSPSAYLHVPAHVEGSARSDMRLNHA
jgi:hypothetical protein